MAGPLTLMQGTQDEHWPLLTVNSVNKLASPNV
jgi:hypothetical protein